MPPGILASYSALYAVFFFIAAQLISWLAFAQPPNTGVLTGGALIVSGGLVIALWSGSL